MKANFTFPFIAIALLIFSSSLAKATQIEVGTDIAAATRAMKEAGYPTTGLEMRSRDRDGRLAFWSVDDGVLIVVHSSKTKRVIGMSYWFSDGRSKFKRKTFDLEVTSFDTATGSIVIQTEKPKGADQRAEGPQAKQVLTPKMSKRFGDVFDATIEFVDKPNTYYAQNLIKVEWYARVVAVNGKALGEPILMEYRSDGGDFKKGQTVTLRAYEDIESSGVNREWDGIVRQFNYGLSHFLRVKRPTAKK